MVGTVTAAGADPRPAAVVVAVGVAVGVAGLQVGGLLAFVVVIVVRATQGDQTSWLNVALLCVVLLAWAAGLGVAAGGLSAGRRWSRAPLVVSELLLLAVSVSVIQGGVGWLGWPLGVGAALAVVAMFTPAMTRLLGQPGA
jgi:hypothetical protein